MKLLRLGPAGQECPAILLTDGTYRDLRPIVNDLAGEALGPESIARIEAADHSTLPELAPDLRIGPCVGSVGKFVCVGLNYADHAKETGAALPPEPILFQKATSSICGAEDDIIIPRGATKLDWEVELAVVIGKGGRYIDEADAMSHVVGYCVCNDISERAFQVERGGQWTKGKSADTFGPIGPWLVTTDEIEDPQNLNIWLEVDGERRQNGNTRTMIFGVGALVSYISQFMSLQSGDIIATGTPPGVAMGMKPTPKWLQAGSRMRVGIDGLGVQVQTVV